MAYLVFFGGLGMLAGSVARLLLGRLRSGARVPPPWCELTVGALWAGCGLCWAVGLLPGRWLPLLLGLAWLGVAAGATDLVHRRLPDALTLPALPAAVLAVLPLGVDSLGRALLGAALLFAAHLAVRMVSPGALGAGDVKLAAPLGAVLGAVAWPALLLGALLASALTAVFSLAGRLVGRVRGCRDPAAGVPHGPSMLASAWAVLAASALGSGAG